LPVSIATAPAFIVADAMELGLPLSAAKAYVGLVAPLAVAVEPSTLAVAVADTVAAFAPLNVNPVPLHPVIVPAYLRFAVMY